MVARFGQLNGETAKTKPSRNVVLAWMGAVAALVVVLGAAAYVLLRTSAVGATVAAGTLVLGMPDEAMTPTSDAAMGRSASTQAKARKRLEETGLADIIDQLKAYHLVAAQLRACGNLYDRDDFTKAWRGYVQRNEKRLEALEARREALAQQVRIREPDSRDRDAIVKSLQDGSLEADIATVLMMNDLEFGALPDWEMSQPDCLALKNKAQTGRSDLKFAG